MTVRTLDSALPELLSKAVERGHRIVVKAGSEERIEALDTLLWTYDAASFLPHGHQKDGHTAQNPIWLTTQDDNPNAADVLILTDGTTGDVQNYALCCEMFDGRDDNAVHTARMRWKRYKDDGLSVVYYQQSPEGRWEQKS